jgi:protein TonB
MPESPTSRPKSAASAWLPSRRALLAMAIAFAAGLLLFLALWLDKRDSNNFYRTVEAPRSTEGQVFAPLPVPAPAGEDGHLGGEDDGGGPLPAPLPPPRPAAPAPLPSNVPAPAPAAPVAAVDSTPRPISTPAPRYPREAQRRGVAGTVLLRVHVGIDGEPGDIDLVQGSGSRDLDRAAVEGVRRWRFAPATRNGQPVESSVQVPIAFNLK